MGFFDRLKESLKPSSGSLNAEKWEFPQNVADLKKHLNNSSETVCIYKHSIACGTCVFTLRNLDRVIEKASEKATFCFIEVRRNRELSNLVEKETGIRHQSPQLIILAGGRVAWSASHGAIQTSAVLQALDEAAGQ